MSKPTKIETTAQIQTSLRYTYAVQLLGRRWIGLILHVLLQGPARFSQLTSVIEDLSDRVLSERLRDLETEGIVQRVVYPQTPVLIEYQLTEKGYALKPVFEAIYTWSQQCIEAPLSHNDDQEKEANL